MSARHCPLSIPKTVARFAVQHEIPLKLIRSASWDDWYYAAGTDTTRSAQPKVSHALALCRRYLAQQVSKAQLADRRDAAIMLRLHKSLWSVRLHVLDHAKHGAHVWERTAG